MNQKTKLIIFGIGGLFFFLVAVFGFLVARHEPVTVLEKKHETSKNSSSKEESIEEIVVPMLENLKNFGCIDSDTLPGEIDDMGNRPSNIFTKGSVTVVDTSGKQRTSFDVCASDNRVDEWRCDETFENSEKYVAKHSLVGCQYKCGDGACLSKEESYPNGPTQKGTCADNDAAQKPNDIYHKGEVTTVNEYGVKHAPYYDECIVSKNGFGKQVGEWQCYEGSNGNYHAMRKRYDCPNGCSDGACKR